MRRCYAAFNVLDLEGALNPGRRL